MAVATPAEVARLTEAYRTAQNRRAALIAALAIQWWRQRVNTDKPETVDQWLQAMIPRIVAAHGQNRALASVYYRQLRALEAPGAPPFQVVGADPLEPDRVRASLIATGPAAVRRKVAAFDKMTTAELARQLEVNPADYDKLTVSHEMLRTKAHEEAAVQISGAAVRHVANGGRETLQRSAEADPVALGWVRVTDGDPCYFCAMLASRGLERGIFKEDSFSESDARFQGPGNAKVHDHCGCSLKPVYGTNDAYVAKTDEFYDRWLEFSGDGDGDPLTNFRRHWEGRAKAA